MQSRQLDLSDFDAVIREVERLHHDGYRPVGKWNLAQVCDHLSYFMEGSLDGATYKVLWLFRVLFGRLVFNRIMKTGAMKANVPTPQKPLPEPGGDETAAVERLTGLIERLKKTTGELHASPFFGRLTNEEWRRLHLIHSSHHLGYSLPVGTENV